MESIARIKKHYNFTVDDVQNLKRLAPQFLKYKEKFAADFYNNVKGYEDASKYLTSDEVILSHQKSLMEWYEDLFSGNYTNQYLNKLENIGAVHVNIGLPCHYVNVSMYFVKEFCLEILRKVSEDPHEFQNYSRSISKIIDINLDVMTSSYMVEEVNRYFIFQKLENMLVKFSKKFAYGLNLLLVLGLVMMGMMVIGLFFWDISHVMDGNFEQGILHTLGSLLMLWVVIELLDTEIDHLQGGKFAVKVFVGVGLVAVIRKVLVKSLAPGDYTTQIYMVALLAVLGIVYWLIAKVENEKS